MQFDLKDCYQNELDDAEENYIAHRENPTQNEKIDVVVFRNEWMVDVTMAC